MLLGLLCSSSLTFYYLGILQHLQFPLSQAMMELHIHSGCIVLITGIHERTFIAIKPDGVQRRLVGEIIRRFEQKGFKLIGMKILQASENLLKDHYIDLRDRPFYNGLVKYMSSGPLVAMVWQGLDVVKITRAMMGETNPADSAPGTIRGDFCVEVGRSRGTWV
ncbi:nucleoside diphosphate kinase 3 isoform X3 [Stegostoma tigrinum]|uniref:nucleoside diphosphate kinase 3 isoform X3 n=1 Tax=Stegostoma tigrinum TaxID=3053191 RepID=UPI00202B63F4|nr:nucleoside diphosphate kinase 3 isoform X3 [Stegostoma tigrinum]